MLISRRRFLDAAALLAVSSPLAGCATRRPQDDGWRDAVDAAQAVREGRTTASVLVEKAIERLERANPQINAVALPDYERARHRAARSPDGPLGGVPTLIKDVIDEAGRPNTVGTRLLRDNIAQADAPYVQAIARAGLISIGRSTVPEFAANASTESPLTGPTRNPWNLDYSAGGSSGGAAAAVAAGVVAVAHASDGAGSTRHAAAPCGLVGLKPSRGRLIGEETQRAISDFAVQGCVSRTVRDTAAWFAATEATGPDAPYSPVGVISAPLTRRLRIGANPRLTRSGADPHDEVAEVFDHAIAMLEELGHRVEDQPLAFDGEQTYAAFLDFFQGRSGRRIAAFESLLGRPLTTDDVEPATLGMMADGLEVSDAALARADDVLADMAERYIAQFDDIDLYMTPVFSTPPVRLGELGPDQPWPERRDRLLDYGSYCWVDNAAGTPAISLPLGFSRAGLPVGIQFAASPGGEQVLLELAYQLETVVGWADLRPPVWVG